MGGNGMGVLREWWEWMEEKLDGDGREIAQ